MDESATVGEDMPAYLTTGQLAARWGMSPGHLANMRCEGRGPTPTHLGSAVRYSREEVLRCEREGWA